MKETEDRGPVDPQLRSKNLVATSRTKLFGSTQQLQQCTKWDPVAGPGATSHKHNLYQQSQLLLVVLLVWFFWDLGFGPLCMLSDVRNILHSPAASL